MPCRECDVCGRRFGTGINDTVECVFCGGVLSYSSGPNPTITAEEYKAQLYVKGKVIPGPLSDEEREKLEAEWAALEAEEERRAPWFSVADLIGDGFRPEGLTHS